VRQRVAAGLGVGLLAACLAISLARERGAPASCHAVLDASTENARRSSPGAPTGTAVTRDGDRPALEAASPTSADAALEARDFLVEVVDEMGTRGEGAEIYLCRESRRSARVDSFESVGSSARSG
jgi:hypothetical protein